MEIVSHHRKNSYGQNRRKSSKNLHNIIKISDRGSRKQLKMKTTRPNSLEKLRMSNHNSIDLKSMVEMNSSTYLNQYKKTRQIQSILATSNLAKKVSSSSRINNSKQTKFPLQKSQDEIIDLNNETTIKKFNSSIAFKKNISNLKPRSSYLKKSTNDLLIRSPFNHLIKNNLTPSNIKLRSSNGIKSHHRSKSQSKLIEKRQKFRSISQNRKKSESPITAYIKELDKLFKESKSNLEASNGNNTVKKTILWKIKYPSQEYWDDIKSALKFEKLLGSGSFAKVYLTRVI